MLERFRLNFGEKSICQLCKDHSSKDCQEHRLLNFDVVRDMIPEIRCSTATYLDIFLKNTAKIREVASLCEQSIRLRERILGNAKKTEENECGEIEEIGDHTCM